VPSDTEAVIWNRAAIENGGTSPGPGDVALASALRLHGMVMSGGLDHACEVLDRDMVAAAVSGFRYLGADDAAELVESVEALLASGADDQIEQANRRYDELIPADSRLSDLATVRMREAPGDFAPV
jgi:hypothetical protein